MVPIVEPIGDPVELGEGPIYDPESKNLYFVDIFQSSVCRYDTVKKQQYSAKLRSGGTVSMILQIEGEKNKFIIAHNNNLEIIFWDGICSTIDDSAIYARIESVKAKTRLNDGKADPVGRIWAGTMGPKIEGTVNDFVLEQGSLYMVNQDRDVSKQLSKMGICNGLAWNVDRKKFYFIDSLKYRIDSYDYDNTSGDISNEKTVFDFKPNNIEGLPDGMTIDTDGNLWVACYGGGQIIQINPESGTLLQTIKLPSLEITSACFGGANYDELYVTSAKKIITKEELNQYPHAGNTFKITNLGLRGTPSSKVKV